MKGQNLRSITFDQLDRAVERPHLRHNPPLIKWRRSCLSKQRPLPYQPPGLRHPLLDSNSYNRKHSRSRISRPVPRDPAPKVSRMEWIVYAGLHVSVLGARSINKIETEMMIATCTVEIVRQIVQVALTTNTEQLGLPQVGHLHHCWDERQ
jgi:hypothetical protein